MVFLASFSLMSFASEEIKVMNSTQHSMSRSRASLENVCPEEGGRISVMIFWTVAMSKQVSQCPSNALGPPAGIRVLHEIAGPTHIEQKK
jgi:hypothetical protein